MTIFAPAPSIPPVHRASVPVRGLPTTFRPAHASYPLSTVLMAIPDFPFPVLNFPQGRFPFVPRASSFMLS